MDDPKFDAFKDNWATAQETMDKAVAALATEQAAIDFTKLTELTTAVTDAEAALKTIMTFEDANGNCGYTDGKKVFESTTAVEADKSAKETAAAKILTDN